MQKTPLGKGGELWLTDALKTYIKQGGVMIAKKVEDGEWLTTGDPLNFLRTTLKYAVKRDDIGKELKRIIKKEIC